VSLFTFQNLDEMIKGVKFKKEKKKYATHGVVYFHTTDDMNAAFLRLRKRTDVTVEQCKNIGQWCTVMLQKTIMILSCY